MLLHHFQSLLNQISHVVTLTLGVVDLVTGVFVSVFQKVEHWQDLPVVGHQSLSHCFVGQY